MTKTFVHRLTLLIASVALLPFAAAAQETSSITGVVTDASGAVLPNVAVELTNTKTGAHYSAKTNRDGSYRIVDVSPGPNYTERFSASGFIGSTVTELYLPVATTRTQNVQLQAGTSVEVSVSAGNESVTINTTDATVGNVIDVKSVNDLPVQNRGSLQVLFSLEPGITGGAVTGARQDQSTTTIDGIDVNDIAAGQSGSGFNIVAGAPVDSVQEFRGTVAGFVSSDSTGGGGQFHLVTKSGTNSFHGSINEYHRDPGTVANDWFNNANGIPKTHLVQNQFGGNIGGPIKKDKLFFFFNYYGQRIARTQATERIVPLDSFRNGQVNYIKLGTNASGGVCNGASRLNTTPECIGTLTSAQVAALDPQGIGFDPALLTFINQRFPHANVLNDGDGINTGGFRFNAQLPRTDNNYVTRIDWNASEKHKVFGRFTINRTNLIYQANYLPADPQTSPFLDNSYAYVVGDTWTISSNKVNQFLYGDTIQKVSFPNQYNPTGINQLSSGLFGFYTSGSSQRRRVPIPEVRDDFSWIKGTHSLVLGGTFKFVKTNSQLVNDFNFDGLGLGGNTNQLNASLRPNNIRTVGTVASSTYDNAFALALGRVASITSNYNFNAAGSALPQGNGAVRQYRYYQTELYFSDVWKVTPSLTVNYGVRYQYYSVPFEARGIESVPNVTSFDSYFGARLQQSAAGISGPTAVPFISYNLGGRANSGAKSLYSPNALDFAPHVAFNYSPSFDPKTVFLGSAGIVYDRTVINAVNFIQDQSSYLFQNSTSRSYGKAGDARTSLLNDPRLGASLALPAPPVAPAIGRPFTPYVSNGVPYGLANNNFNTIIDPKLKDPYSITYNFGMQHEFPGNYIFKASYVGRLGRRLLAQADASQLIDFADSQSGQTLSQAFAALTLASRAGVAPAPQPFFENQVGAGATAFYAANFDTFNNRGDFADFVQGLASSGDLQPNVGLAAQFAGNTFETNKGFSSYNGLLATLSKNLSYGLKFDVNYTWSRSIDNTSQVANSIAAGTGYGFLCDARNNRTCRGLSDFDIAHVINSNVVYDLPFGRKRQFAANTPGWLDEVIGGWQVSGLPNWRSGIAYNVSSNAYVAGYANNAPATLVGNIRDLSAHIQKQPNGQVFQFANAGTTGVNSFVGPVGFNIGSRNLLRSSTGFFFDAGIAKDFRLYRDDTTLQFRADLFNALNHPVFGFPTADITSGQFGQITSTLSAARIAQFSARIDF